MGWNAKDAIGFAAMALATFAIAVNVVFMQSGVHPAPMFKSALAAPKLAATTSVTGEVSKSAAVAAPAVVPRARPAEHSPIRAALPAAEPAPAKPADPPKAAAPPSPRPPGEIITDIQRELSRRGFYEGAVDGLYGPKTDGAIRDFEQAAGLKPSLEPSEALLTAITRAPAKIAKTPAAATPSPAVRSSPIRNDTVGERPTPSKRIVALQRALADYGYGQIKPTGLVDGETKAAIEKFERERRLPVTGQPSDRVARELAAMTGRPLE
jgi:peptidoglycan hydrolase-like protein with peptidoglycan-binding domain